MIVVYLRNGEKAPMPDADNVQLDSTGHAGTLMLRCFFAEREVGQFKWDEVAGYTISVLNPADFSPTRAYEAWGVNQQP